MEQRKLYADAVAGKRKAECIMDIQRRFFKRFPVDLDDSTEPDPESLKEVDDSAPDPETSFPDESLLSPEEYAVASEAFTKRRQAVEFRKAVSCFPISVRT